MRRLNIFIVFKLIKIVKLKFIYVSLIKFNFKFIKMNKYNLFNINILIFLYVKRG